MRSVFRPSSFVSIIIAVYLVIGTLYAVKTPAWQVPDEPAHYNYVRYIAEGRGLPVLQQGDYDQDYLERIKAAKFPSSMPIDSIRYEFWQPPLYYILAAPIYLATGGSLLALRLFSVVLGGLVVVFAFLIVRQLAPDSPVLALGTAAFVAFVPQHVAMMAGAQNDGLAELLLVVVVFQISNLKSQISHGKWITAGILLGLGLMTKGTIYVAVPLVAVAIWLSWRSRLVTPALVAPRRCGASMNHQAESPQPAQASSMRTVHFPSPSQPDDSSSDNTRWTWLIKTGALVFIPALIIALPLWIRNIIVYGWPDFLVSIRHDAVVVGQPTPAEWVSRFGWGEYLRQFVVTTFHSFWGQFGWMGVPMNDRYYTILALAALAAFIGLAWYANADFQVLNIKRRFGVPDLRFEVWILMFWVLFAVMTYIGYNVKYVQFQGRYLFPALIPIGLAFTIGLRQWTKLLPRIWRGVALAAPFVGLVVLDLIALFRMIVPMLSP